jgi:hypothetical protein
MKNALTDGLVTFKLDPNNGAGLWAVFVGEMPIHHFSPTANVERYMARLSGEIDKWFHGQAKGKDSPAEP